MPLSTSSAFKCITDNARQYRHLHISCIFVWHRRFSKYNALYHLFHHLIFDIGSLYFPSAPYAIITDEHDVARHCSRWRSGLMTIIAAHFIFLAIMIDDASYIIMFIRAMRQKVLKCRLRYRTRRNMRQLDDIGVR